MLAGEYVADSGSGRVTHFDLNSSNGRLERVDGVATSTLTYRQNRTKTQGIVSAYGYYFYNHSYASDQYRIHIRDDQGGVLGIRGGYGLEDLYYDNSTHRLWFLTEHPGGRKVWFRDDPIGTF